MCSGWFVMIRLQCLSDEGKPPRLHEKSHRALCACFCESVRAFSLSFFSLFVFCCHFSLSPLLNQVRGGEVDCQLHDWQLGL